MSVDGILARGRVAALKLMRDACIVERKAGGPTLNPTTGQIEQQWETIYAGRCRGKPESPSEAEFGERQVTFLRFTVAFPWDTTPPILREDRVTLTASDDDWLIGRHLHVIGVSLNGTSTTRRVTAEDRAG